MDPLIDRIERWVVFCNPACTQVLLHPDDEKALGKIKPEALQAMIGNRPIKWLGKKDA